MSLSRRVRPVLVAALLVLLLVLVPSTASAHTAFSGSTPADGDVIAEPVSLVTLVFTAEAAPAGDGFVALTPEGIVQQPSAVETVDDKVFSVRFDPPLAGGVVGLKWSVRAGDAHPIEGAFSFTVSTPAPTTVPAPTAAPVATPPVTIAAVTTIAEAVVTDDASTSVPPTSTAVPVDAAAPAGDDGAVDEPDESSLAAGAGSGVTPDAPAQSLDEFLAVDNGVPGEGTATIGRLVGLLGVALGIGALAFVGTALRGRRGEIDRAILAIRLFGAAIAVGAVIEYVGVAKVASDSLGSAWSTASGFATVLRMVGGIGLALGLGGALIAAASASRPAARPLSAAVVTDSAVAGAVSSTSSSSNVRWTPTSSSWPALGGAALIVVSFWFDGHTVTKGFRLLHGVVNSVHVVAGSIWVGGVVALAAVAWTRHRSGRSTGVAELVVRFSRVATIALVSVVMAGGVMAVLVLDGFGELTGTPWGQILLLKTAAVAIAAAAGAYNHFRLVPALDEAPEAPELLARLRSTLTCEAIFLVFVITVTAWLVAAAS